jgi:hypothetical protein
LIVAAAETATALTVKATSTVDTGKNGTATVTVTDPTDGSLGIIIGSSYGAITITGSDGENIISKTGTTQTLHLSADGYTNVAWYVDGAVAGIPDSGITIDAGYYPVDHHTVTFTGERAGIPYSRVIPFTVIQ